MFRQRRGEVLSSDNCVACDGGREMEVRVHAAFIPYCKLCSPDKRTQKREPGIQSPTGWFGWNQEIVAEVWGSNFKQTAGVTTIIR